MANEEAESIPGNVAVRTPEERGAIAAHELQSDHVLARIVAAINTVNNGGYDVTLSVGGQLITGRLVPALEYFKAIELELVPDTDPEKAGTEEGPFAVFTEPYRNPADELVTVYLHLRDARYVFPDSRIPSSQNPGLWWRGRISAVDGFSFGRMASSLDVSA